MGGRRGNSSSNRGIKKPTKRLKDIPPGVYHGCGNNGNQREIYLGAYGFRQVADSKARGTNFCGILKDE